MKKGLIVTICAPSQSGKDYIMQLMVNALKENGLPCRPATAYKTRKPRTTDAAYIKTVDSAESLPISAQDRYEFTYGDDKVIYDKNEISEALDRGEIVFVATCIPGLCYAIRSDFEQNCLGVYLRSERKRENAMLLEEGKRHGISISKWNPEPHENLQQIVDERTDIYEKMKDEYIKYAGDKQGADYITRNWFTFFGGDWNTKLSHTAQTDMDDLFMEIVRVFEAIADGQDWRKKNSLTSSDEERQKNPLSLKQDFLEYLYEKERENNV